MTALFCMADLHESGRIGQLMTLGRGCRKGVCLWFVLCYNDQNGARLLDKLSRARRPPCRRCKILESTCLMESSITLSVIPDAAEGAREPAIPVDDSDSSQPTGAIRLDIRTGETIVVTGPNGVGKSALLAEIARDLGRRDVAVETFFGNRQVYFDSDEVDQIGRSVEQFRLQLRQNVTRFRHPWGEVHLKSIVRRIINMQTQSAYNIITAQQNGMNLREALDHYPQIVAAINSIFATARLPVRIIIADGVLRAQRESYQYGIERLSDGERAALLIVGAVLVQPPDSYIIIDEPERHLNPAIAGALLAGLVRARSDLGYIFATHDLELLEWLDPSQIIHLRNSQVMQGEPDQRQFDLYVLTREEGLPEELRFAVLGSRRLVILVEGSAASEDKALYAHIYPSWDIVARGGWEAVANGVRALRGNRLYHWLHAVGIVDRDGRDDAERASLARDQIFCLPVPTIENLFLHPIAIEAMAARMHELKGGPTGAVRVQALKQALNTLLPNCKEDIIVRRLIWEGNRLLSEQKLSYRSVQSGQTEIGPISLNLIRQRLDSDFDEAIARGDPLATLLGIPIKNSSIPNRIAVELGFDNFKDYSRAILHQIDIGSPAGETMLKELTAFMPKLPAA